MADQDKWFSDEESDTDSFEGEVIIKSTLTVADEAIDNFSMTKLGIKNGYYQDYGVPPYSVMVMEDIPFSYYSMMRDLNHQNLLRLRNYWYEKSLLITEAIDGTLENYVKAKAEELFLQENDGSYSLSESFKILIRDILEGLRYLHSMRVYHNNMHPKNTFVTEIGSKILVKLFHFKGRHTAKYGSREEYIRGEKEDWKNLKNLIKECYDVHEYQPSSIVRSFFKFLDGNLVSRTTIFEHPIFWENDMDKRRYLFRLRRGSDALRVKNTLDSSTLLQWPDDEWINLIVEEENKRGERNYSMASPYDFVRLIDNKLMNYDELPDDFRCEYGIHRDAFLYYVEGLVPNIWEILFEELGPIAKK